MEESLAISKAAESGTKVTSAITITTVVTMVNGIVIATTIAAAEAMMGLAWSKALEPGTTDAMPSLARSAANDGK